MIVGFSKHGTGGGRGPVQYLTAARNPDRSARTPPPVILRGNPPLVRQLIDALPFKYKYTSGVLSFAEAPEAITPDMRERIMDEFERVAFAGLDKDHYAILWTQHTHAGRMELNFLVPRVELSTGKSLNIAPPGKATRALFDTFRSMVNATYALADPDDPARRRDVSLPHHLAKLIAAAKREGEQLTGPTALRRQIIEAITAYVRREVDAGRVKSREDVAAYLERQEYAIARHGKEYLTIVEPETGERIRLKGGLYSPAWFATRPPGQHPLYTAPDPERAAVLAATLEGLTAARARYHRERYGLQDRGESLPCDLVEPLAQYSARTLAEQTMLPAEEDGLRAPSTRRRQSRQRMHHAATAIEHAYEDVLATR